jgi:DNA mismatch repair protein MSH3
MSLLSYFSVKKKAETVVSSAAVPVAASSPDENAATTAASSAPQLAKRKVSAVPTVKEPNKKPKRVVDDDDDDDGDDRDDAGCVAVERVVRTTTTNDTSLADLQRQVRDEIARVDFDAVAAGTTALELDRFSQRLTGLRASRTALTNDNDNDNDNNDGVDANDDVVDDDDDADVDDKPPKKRGLLAAAASSSSSASTSIKYTPGELQYLALRDANPGVVLAIEIGYKFEFVGEDAEIAHRLLKLAIFARKGSHLLKCCVPTNRIYYHVRRLVIAGFKVGLVRQTETAALKKVSGSKSKTFDRQVDKLFTRATFVGTDDIDPLEAREDTESGGYVMLLREEATAADGTARFAFVALHTSTGEVVYDHFDDVFLRTELDTRLELLDPKELLLARGGLSAQTQALIAHRSGFSFDADNDGGGGAAVAAKREQRGRLRVEQLPPAWFDVAAAGVVIKDYCLEIDAGSGANRAAAAAAAADADEDDATEEVPGLQRGGPVDATAAADADVAALAALPQLSLVCVAALLTYAKQLRHLGPLLRCHENYRRFSSDASGAVCHVPGAAARNLELFESNTPGLGTHGTLLGHLDRTLSALGSRELQRWLQAPLADAARIRERQAAVALLRPGSDRVDCLQELLKVLKRAPDIERGLARLYNRSCNPSAFVKLLDAFVQVLDALPSAAAAQRQFAASPYLVRLLDGGGQAAAVRACIAEALAALSRDGAKDNDMQRLFVPHCPLFPDVTALTASIADVTQQLNTTHLNEARRIVSVPTLAYKTVSQQEYLLEVTLTQKSRVPADWTLISSTKQCARYRSAAISKAFDELQRARERLTIAASAAWRVFQARFAARFGVLRAVVSSVATIDALLALAEVAALPNYVQPTIEAAGDEPLFEARDSRHPVLEALDLSATVSGSSAYVPNDIAIGAPSDAAPHNRRCLVVTGANMAGKSAYVRQVATLALMAQIGSFVPAASMRLRPFDGVFVRMGASDNLAAGHSTFFVELHETSTMLQRATPRSLLLLDELGRGTSTTDGTAIAHATLDHVARGVRAACLFVTHFPSIGVELERDLPRVVGNFHMAFVAHEADADGVPRISFLYKLRQGVASSSFGLNVARMAGLSSDILRVALDRSDAMQSAETVTQFVHQVILASK